MVKKIPPLHSLTWLWFSLLTYSLLFWLLQKILFFIPGVSEGTVLLLSSAVSSAVPLIWSASTGDGTPPFPATKASPGLLVFLMSISLSGNLAISLFTPVLEQIWNLVGFTALPAGDATATPLLVLYICVVAPILEELVYRGVVLRRLLPGGERQAILLSALCFAFMHHDLYQRLAAFWGGLILGYAALHHGLRVSVGLHVAENSIAMALTLLQQAGAPGDLAALAVAAVPGVISATGICRLMLKRRRQSPGTGPSGGNGDIWRNPALWALLAFDTIYLFAASFSRL